LGARRPLHDHDHDVVTHNEDWAACAASVDPELIEATFAGLAADLAPPWRPSRSPPLFHPLTTLPPAL